MLIVSDLLTPKKPAPVRVRADGLCVQTVQATFVECRLILVTFNRIVYQIGMVIRPCPLAKSGDLGSLVKYRCAYSAFCFVIKVRPVIFVFHNFDVLIIGTPHLCGLVTAAVCGWVTNLCPTCYVIEAELATSPLPERSSEVSPYRRPSRCHISASPKLEAVGLLNGRDASGRHPRSESVAFGLEKNGNCTTNMCIDCD